MRMALADPEITHLCLLNNDVILTDCWLDRLVEQSAGCLVGPLSNSVGNEQLIPVPCASRAVSGYMRESVRRFAADWAHAHRGNVVESQTVAFFCVIGERRLFETVGELDERFGLGYFEDDDYNLRCLAAGFQPKIARSEKPPAPRRKARREVDREHGCQVAARSRARAHLSRCPRRFARAAARARQGVVAASRRRP